MELFDPAVPLMPQGRMTTIGEAAQAADFPIVLPAALGEPSETWVGVREIGLRYPEHGIVVVLARFPGGRDPSESLAARIQGLPMAYMTTVEGNPGAVLPYDPELALAPIDVVYVFVDGVEVSIYGAAAGAQVLEPSAGSRADELIDVAASLETYA